MLFKAAVVTLWTFVEYFIAIPARPLACSAAQGSRLGGGASAPLPPPFGYATGGLCRRAVSVRMSVRPSRSWTLSEQKKPIFKIVFTPF